MGTFKSLVVGAVGFAITSVGTWNTLETVLQSGTPSQPGQPSKQPSPSNPTPRPKNQQPRPQDPTPDPSNPGAPSRDRQPNVPRDRDAPGDRDARRDDGAGSQDRYVRPFAFQSPTTEGHFTAATRRLVQMEQRMQRSQETLLKSLGEARRLSGPRQTEALFDVIQQMLRDQAELQRYLAQSRTAWSGDIALDETEDGEEPQEGTPPASPAAEPAGDR